MIRTVSPAMQTEMELVMTFHTQASRAAANSRAAAQTLREKAEHISAVALPKAASVTESAGKAISSFALSSSDSLARTLREHNVLPSVASSALIAQLRPLLRSTVRLARRNPLLFATAGAAVAVLGYVALHKKDEEDAASA